MSVYSSSVRPASGPYPVVAAPPGSPPSKKQKIWDDNEIDLKARGTHSTLFSSSLLGFPRPPHVMRQPTLPADQPRIGKQPLQKLYTLPVPAPLPPVAKQPALTQAAQHTLAKPGGNGLLLASYLAHEFLSRGTLFGCPCGVATATSKKRKQQYEEVAKILWVGGVHVPGVINPTQLRGWLQKQQEK